MGLGSIRVSGHAAGLLARRVRSSSSLRPFSSTGISLGGKQNAPFVRSHGQNLKRERFRGVSSLYWAPSRATMSRRTWQDGLFRGKSLDESKSARGGSSVGRRCGHRGAGSVFRRTQIWTEQHRGAFRDEGSHRTLAPAYCQREIEQGLGGERSRVGTMYE